MSNINNLGSKIDVLCGKNSYLEQEVELAWQPRDNGDMYF